MRVLIPYLPMLSAALLTLPSCTHPASHRTTQPQLINQPSSAQASSFEQRAIALTNKERERRGLQPVRTLQASHLIRLKALQRAMPDPQESQSARHKAGDASSPVEQDAIADPKGGAVDEEQTAKEIS